MRAYDIDNCAIEPRKHFRNKYMRQWGWDMFDLRQAIKEAYTIDQVGKKKYEAYTKKGAGSEKIIFVYDKEDNVIFVISGAEKK